MVKKQAAQIKVIRNGERVDRNSPQIRTEQASRLKKEKATILREVTTSEDVKLLSKKPEEIYSAGKQIRCRECDGLTPTPRMFRYPGSSHGAIILCEICDEKVEVRSFYKLDALDLPGIRKQYKVD
jgi:hypothetical protein